MLRKMSLNDFKLESFVTSLETIEHNKLEPGATIQACTQFDGGCLPDTYLACGAQAAAQIDFNYWLGGIGSV